LPQIALLFLFIAILEDCGYMARAAFLMDKLMARCGLSGKSFIPMLSSVACAIPGIMATRVIENRRDRLTTILVAPLMSCSARLPVYILMIGAFLPVSIVIVALFTAGVSFLLFTVTSRFADVREMYTVIVQTWFFLTPIVYEPSIVPFRYRVLLSLNPMYHLIQVFRKPIYDGVLPSPTLLAGSFAFSVAMLVTGWVYFSHRSDQMAYWS